MRTTVEVAPNGRRRVSGRQLCTTIEVAPKRERRKLHTTIEVAPNGEEVWLVHPLKPPKAGAGGSRRAMRDQTALRAPQSLP